MKFRGLSFRDTLSALKLSSETCSSSALVSKTAIELIAT